MIPLILMLAMVVATEPEPASAPDEPLEVWLPPVVHSETEFIIDADEWARPRSGERVLALDAVRAVVAEWLTRPESTIVIRYPGGETGSLWAAELRDWLISLGLPRASLELRPGADTEGALALRIEN